MSAPPRIPWSPGRRLVRIDAVEGALAGEALVAAVKRAPTAASVSIPAVLASARSESTTIRTMSGAWVAGVVVGACGMLAAPWTTGSHRSVAPARIARAIGFAIGRVIAHPPRRAKIATIPASRIHGAAPALLGTKAMPLAARTRVPHNSGFLRARKWIAV